MPKHHYVQFVRVGGSRPPYYAVGEYLWGVGADLDSDGDACDPEDLSWTELTLMNRRDITERIDVDPVQAAPLVLKVMGTKAGLVERAARYLAEASGGDVVRNPSSGA